MYTTAAYWKVTTNQIVLQNIISQKIKTHKKNYIQRYYMYQIMFF